MLESLRLRFRRRRNIGELTHLDPYLLADIGLSRPETMADNAEMILMLPRGPFERHTL